MKHFKNNLAEKVLSGILGLLIFSGPVFFAPLLGDSMLVVLRPGVEAQQDTDRWTHVGQGIISPNREQEEGLHHRSGKAIQASWHRDNIQKRDILSG